MTIEKRSFSALNESLLWEFSVRLPYNRLSGKLIQKGNNNETYFEFPAAY